MTDSIFSNNSIPREGIHKYRIPYIDLAAVDVFGTILFGGIITYILEKKYDFGNLEIIGIFIIIMFILIII